MISAAVHKSVGNGPRSRGMGCCGNDFIQCDGYFGTIGGSLWMSMNLVRVMMDCARMIRIHGIGRGKKTEINKYDLMFFYVTLC